MDIVSTDNAPKAVGPYSQAIKANGMLFCSGQIPLVPDTMTVISDSIEEQTEQVLKNLRSVLEAGGSSLNQVVKTTIFLQNMSDFAVVNGIYEKTFGDHKPARATVAVAGLPLGVKVEIECVALTGNN